MEANIERECSALGGLFQQIITDMKNGTPLWEDLVAKATKLHTCLRATIQAIAAYLDAFQKIADAATNTRGATKEIGTALTRICLRHKAVEARMKTFTSAIMDCLVVPLQEKLEEWKKTVINLDKEHAKEYKRARAELKKRSTDTLRLQKKARKGKSGELQRRVESSMQDVTERRQLLEETEKQAVRAALIEERSRFCLLVAFLKPVVDEEVAMLSELSHLQEVVDQIQKHTADPYTLPPASEQVISDLKGSESSWSFQTPPSSPSSLGSRKSSMCSISSLNSSSSGSTKSHHSPSHHYWHRSVSQQPLAVGILRLPSVSSQDSGFTSQDVLFPRPPSVQSVKVSNMSEPSSNSGSNSSTPSTPYAGTGSAVTLPNTTATWPNLQETLQFERAATAIMSERPHTISSDSPQPMYVNMHELATMAASKAQEMNFPPPPPELANPAPETQEKTEGGEKDGSTSESSLESSSGYGSQIIQVEDAAHNEEMSLSVCSLEAASKYCTLPRSGESTLPSGPRRRPLSTTGYPSSTMKNALLRRGSVQGQKPPPPIRRTSSISNSARQSTLSPVGGSLENLPPPPAFLLDSGGNTPPQSQSQSPGISVADTVRTLTELKHQPASPSSLRRNSSIRSQSADRRVGETSPGSGLIAAISAKLAPNLSPRNSRRHSEDLNPNSGNRLLQRGITGPGQGFLQTLNTKLALQQQQLQIHGTQLKAVRVRQYIASRTLPDPALCHESLMDQIRRGTTLRRTGTINDRSAPKIR
ncbi:protein MTSS 2 isoform X4 [Anabrus simplex]|uniref:protein MTSS 2 isoform X4 n=1 Tax=Anabrus simplex TaxID=316456 RepID=UPI0034DD1F32